VSEIIIPAIGQYCLECASLDTVSASVLSQWENCRSHEFKSSPMHDPVWLRGYFAGQTGNFLIYSLCRDESICGLASFLKRDWPLKWHLGEFTVAKFPMTRLRLMGGTISFPEDEAAYDALFTQLAKPGAGFDTVYLEEVATDSFIWRYLQESSLIRRLFSVYQPERPSPRPILRFEGSFEDYMNKFSAKHRKNLRREVKKLKEGALGELRFLRFEAPDQVEPFLRDAVEVSRKTYQWNLYQRGLRLTDLVRDRLAFAAQHGWMRCYLVSCGGRACAFLVGFQYEGRFMIEEIGFDPALAKHSVGTVMLMLTVEDLFAHNRPHILDFGEYGRYKEMLSTESYLQGKMLLFIPGARARFIQTGHHWCSASSKTLSSALDRLKVKPKIKKLLRGWNTAP
jgi:GNAT acetyltransferase-like protein